jgi:putative methionine-R-sulfoxide reductase with GAF domain
MPKFEILIPQSAKVPMDMRMRLEAESWTDALKKGRAKLGETEDISSNILVDIKDDNSIHVTDAGTGRVFKILEIPEVSEDEIPTIPPPAEPVAAAPREPAPAAPPEPAPAEPVPPRVAEPVAAAQPPPQKKEAKAPIGRSLDLTSEATADFLEEVFELTQEADAKTSKEDALVYMLDLAMSKIGTDAGSVLLADINQHDLYFGAARGPKAEEVKSFRIKMGQGIVGFCVEEGVGLAVSDVNKDPRFYAKVSEKIGYDTRSILCVPMLAEGRIFGALELINRKESDSFSERDLNIANFIAHHLAEFLQRQS